MVTIQNGMVTMVTVANLEGFGLHLDSTEEHFRHRNPRKCMKIRGGQGRNRSPYRR